jgi:N-acetylmuramoyl-L-alanine amidase
MSTRNIKYIVVHCTATPIYTTIASIKNYWKNEKKWGETPGYHFIVKRNGEVIKLRDVRLITNGVYGHNHECVHIAYIGGIDSEGKPLDNRTEKQKEALFYKIVELSEKFP